MSIMWNYIIKNEFFKNLFNITKYNILNES